ncbi:MAG: heparinase II/III family protein [Candidatus Fimenecus sp.]
MMGNSELQSIAKFCWENWQAYCECTIQTADRVCENRFLFDSPRDMERTENEVSFGEKIDWRYKLNGDEEFMFQLNRHGYLIQLGQAYSLTGDEKYLQHFVRILEDWLDTVPCDYKNNSPWRSLETGMRGDKWLKALRYIEGTKYFSKELKDKIDKSLQIHIELLKKAHSGFQKGSNWGIIQDGGLFHIGVYFAEQEIIDLALARIQEETDLQTLSDGMQWEQSSGYHNEVLIILLDILLDADAHKIPLPNGLREKIESMADAALKTVKPNGHNPLFGDSDDTDIRDIMSRCALVFGRADFKYYGFDCLDYNTVWLTGTDGITAYRQIDKQPPAFTNAFLTDSGTYILRENQTDTANYLCFHNGYTGGGHAHADKLHFDLMIKGRDVLVDAGRYTYLNNAQRRYIKSPKAHNVCLMDNRQYLQMTTQWGVKNPAFAVQYPCVNNAGCTLLGGGHLGYLKAKGAYIARQILYIKPDIYVVIDTFQARFFHTYQQYFHFAPTGKVHLDGEIAEFDDGVVNARLHFLTPNIKIKKEPSIYSSNYNAVCENDAVKASFSAFGRTAAVTVIYGNQSEDFQSFLVSRVAVQAARSKKMLSPEKAQGIVIQTPEKEYTVCLAFEELKEPLVCNGKIGTGLLNVFCEDNRIFKKW